MPKHMQIDRYLKLFARKKYFIEKSIIIGFISNNLYFRFLQRNI